MRVKLAGAERLADSFVLRTPLLPVDDLLGWSDGSEPPSAALRQGLRELLGRREIRGALQVGMPDSEERLGAWLRDPASKQARRFERQLIWYLTRMSTRPTPFGLFAGVSAGAVGDRTSLVLAGRSAYQLRSRLDMRVLLRVVERLLADPALALRLGWRPNSTLYPLDDHSDGRIRYVETHDGGQRLVEVQGGPALTAALQRARRGTTGRELAEWLAGEGHDPLKARAYVQALAREQVLTADLAPALTGPPPAEELLGSLAEFGGHEPLLADLDAATDALRRADAAGVGGCLEHHRHAATLASTLATAQPPRAAVHVDLFKPLAAGLLGANVVAELARGVEALHRVAPPPEDPLAAFAAAFADRYGGQMVELCHVLDETLGIGFRQHPAPPDPRDLLAHLTPTVEPVEPHQHQVHPTLVALLSRALTEGRRELTLTDADLDALSQATRPLPESFAVNATLAAPSGPAADRGDFTILLRSVSGPPATQPFGRFCHIEQVAAIAARHLQQEEAGHPDAIFAEIVHLPDDSHANVLLRPRLRGYEIPYLARSGAPPERQLPVTDLLVGVRDRRVLLWSKTHQREVIPRLSVAHNHPAARSGIYRFLAALAQHQVAGSLTWRWGALAHSVFLPRVCWRRIVLARATWRLPASRLSALLPLQDGELFAKVGMLRTELGLPRLVALVEGRRELVVDLNNALSVRAIANRLRRHSHAVLVEVFPAPELLCVTGPEGRFTHELIVPFTKVPSPVIAGSARNQAAAWQGSPQVQRRFPPGSAWVTLKVYASGLELDRLLRTAVPALIERLVKRERCVDTWHFLRYGDPQWHLRLRLHIREPAALLDVLEAARTTLDPAVENGRLHRVELGTYQREVERYGGVEGVALAEWLFQLDSQTVLRLLHGVGDDPAARWRLALLGMHRWLADFGLALAGRRALCQAGRGALDRNTAVRLGDLYRREGRDLWQLLTTEEITAVGALRPGVEALRARSDHAGGIIAELVGLHRQGRLTVGLATYARSIIHLHVNRITLGNGILYERALYALLDRIYARMQAQPTPSATATRAPSPYDQETRGPTITGRQTAFLDSPPQHEADT